MPALRSFRSHSSSSSFFGNRCSTFWSSSRPEIVGRLSSDEPKVNVCWCLAAIQNCPFWDWSAQFEAISRSKRDIGSFKDSRIRSSENSEGMTFRYGRMRLTRMLCVSATDRYLEAAEMNCAAASRIHRLGCMVSRARMSTSSQVLERWNRPSSAMDESARITFSTTNSSGSVNAWTISGRM